MKAIFKRIIDGDTFVVDFMGVDLIIRVGNVDVPELKTPFGKSVKMELEPLLDDTLDFEVIRKDTHNRYVCNIQTKKFGYLDEYLVKNGFAWHYVKYSVNMKLKEFEREAQDKAIGIWSPEFEKLHFVTKHPQSTDYFNGN